MIKETEVIKTVKEKHKYCDVCGKKILDCYFDTAPRCYYCGKDLCGKCIDKRYIEPHILGGMVYYNNIKCKTCADIIDEYEILSKPLQYEIKRLNNEMKTKCKNNNNGIKT